MKHPFLFSVYFSIRLTVFAVAIPDPEVSSSRRIHSAFHLPFC